jgi:hypothetical protein
VNAVREMILRDRNPPAVFVCSAKLDLISPRSEELFLRVPDAYPEP